jgi:hypothetical protein
LSPAKTISHIIANSQPPPSAYPLTAAIMGFFKERIRFNGANNLSDEKKI